MEGREVEPRILVLKAVDASDGILKKVQNQTSDRERKRGKRQRDYQI